MENYLDIELFGEKHRFRTRLESDRAEEILNRLKREVSKLQGQINQHNSETNKVVVLIGTALNLANENCELKEENAELRAKIEQRSENLIKMLDQNIGKS